MRDVKDYLGGLFLGLLPALIVLYVILSFVSKRFSGNLLGRGADVLERYSSPH